MESQESILQSAANIDFSGQYELGSAGKWGRFIGIAYLSMAGLLLITTIMLFASMDAIADMFMNINGISPEALAFMMGAGKWLFILLMGFSFFVLVLNGFLLAKFGSSSKTYTTTLDEESLSNTFLHLGRYLMLTTVLSIVSTISSIIAFLYYFLT